MPEIETTAENGRYQDLMFPKNRWVREDKQCFGHSSDHCAVGGSQYFQDIPPPPPSDNDPFSLPGAQLVTSNHHVPHHSLMTNHVRDRSVEYTQIATNGKHLISDVSNNDRAQEHTRMRS
jgi:hypothetical protein